MTLTNKPDSEFLKQRLDAIAEGLKEGVRREVQRLREQGLPVYVDKNGTVVALPPQGHDKPTAKE